MDEFSMSDLREALEVVAVPAKAPEMAAYLKDQFACLGVAAPDRKVMQKPTIAAGKHASAEELIAFTHDCWAQPEREFHYVGADLLRRWVNKLDAGHMVDVEEFIASKSWWDTVDTLATNVVGPLVARYPELAAVMDTFIDDPDFWLARTAIIYQLKYKGDTDAERLFRYAEKRSGDTEFFIRKAIGWALRQHSRVDPDAVKAFVAAHEHELSGLSKREALRLL